MNDEPVETPIETPTQDFGPVAPLPSPVQGGSKWRAIISFAIIMDLIIGLVGWNHFHTQPQDVFWAGLSNVFRTDNFTQVSQGGGTDFRLKYDVKDPKKPTVFTERQLDGIKVDGYETLSDTYIKIVDTNGTINPKSTLKPFVNKWIQVRRDGKLSEANDNLGLLGADIEPRQTLFGELIYGHFSDKDQKELAKFIKDQHVYAYNASKTKRTEVNGQKVIEYSVNINEDALLKLNAKMAPLFGLNSEEVTNLFRSGKHEATAKYYITTMSKQIVRLQVTNSTGVTFTNDYSQFNTTTIGAKPKADVQLGDIPLAPK